MRIREASFITKHNIKLIRKIRKEHCSKDLIVPVLAGAIVLSRGSAATYGKEGK